VIASMSRRIEAPRRQHARELRADLPLDVGEGRDQHAAALHPELLPRRQSPLAGLPEALHVDEHRVVRFRRELDATACATRRRW
jgi:hypothetical protein